MFKSVDLPTRLSLGAQNSFSFRPSDWPFFMAKTGRFIGAFTVSNHVNHRLEIAFHETVSWHESKAHRTAIFGKLVITPLGLV